MQKKLKKEESYFQAKMNYLVDSDVIIDYLRDKEPGVSLFKKISSHNLFISIVSFIEIEYGIKKSSKPDKRDKEFADFLNNFSITIIPIDKKIGLKFVEFKTDLENKKNPLADFDLLIAATAYVNNLVLVTRNRKHFLRLKKLKVFGRD